MIMVTTVALIALRPENPANPVLLRYLLSREVQGLIATDVLGKDGSDRYFFRWINNFYRNVFDHLDELAPFPENCLEVLLEALSHPDEGARVFAARSLLKKGLAYPETLRALCDLLDTCDNKDSLIRETPYMAAYQLKQYFPGNEDAISKAMNLVQSSPSLDVQLHGLRILSDLGAGSQKVLDFILDFHFPSSRKKEEFLFIQIDAVNSIGLRDNRAITLVCQWCEGTVYKQNAISTVVKIGAGHPTVIQLLQRMACDSSADYHSRSEAIRGLASTAAGDSEIMLKLIDLLIKEPDERILWTIAETICLMLRDELCGQLVRTLKNEYTTTTEYARREIYYSVLWECSQRMAYPEFYKSWNGSVE
jgi:hypothetical protein